MRTAHAIETGASAFHTADEIEARGAAPARLERWRLPRIGYHPMVHAVRDSDGALIAAALTSGRPATSARKIVDLWWTDESAAAAMLDAVVADARTSGAVAVKWEIAGGASAPGFLSDRGFEAMRRPWAAVGTEQVDGYVLWLAAAHHEEPGYYAQTTLFTCGAVAALMASEGSAGGGFHGDESDRELEIDFWRRASNYPACEPIGLAVAVHDHLAHTPVEVALDLDGPALLEGFTGFDRSFREELQADSLRQATARGIGVRRDRVTVSEIVTRVGSGERALLLIDEAPMHGEAGPHWILAHSVVGGSVVVEDPWISVDAGETWVDTHELPVRPEDLDDLVRWGPDGYRGVIFLPAASAHE